MADEGLGIYQGAMPDKDPYKGVNDVLKLQNNLLQTQSNQTAVDSGKIDLASKQLNHMRNITSDLLNDPEAGRADLTKKAQERAAFGVKMGLFTPAQAVEGMKSFPSDPRQQYQFLTTQLGSVLSAAEKLNAYIGAQTTEGVGAGSVTTQTPQMPGLPVRTRKTQAYNLPPGTTEIVPGGPNKGMASPIGSAGPPPMPSQGPDSMSPVPPGFPQPPGAAPMAPMARPAPMAPGPMQARPQAAPMARPATPVAAPPAAAPVPAQAPAGGRRIVTALPPGTPAAMEASAANYSGRMQAAGSYGQRINPLRQAIPLLEGMKETDVGPTSERWNDLKSAAQTLGAGKLAGIDPEKIRDYNELKKYFNQYTSQVGATLGPKTNEGLATAVTSNPNVGMDRLSALELSKVSLGIERMQQAAALEFQALVDAGQAQPGNFNEFMLQWGTRQDPRGFVYDIMEPKAQEKVRKLPEAERAKVAEAMRIAKKHGLLGDVHGSAQ